MYSYGVEIVQEGNYFYKIASVEKALCDQLYKTPNVVNYRELRELLYDDLRIEETQLRTLNIEDITFLSTLYGSTNVKKLNGYLRRLVCIQ